MDIHDQADNYMLKDFTLPEGQLPALGIAQGHTFHSRP